MHLVQMQIQLNSLEIKKLQSIREIQIQYSYLL